jgi:GNAT superfamily N-acetyltransferase
MRLYEEAASHHFGEGVKLSSWCLLSFGVSAHLRGRGIGRALLKVGEDQVMVSSNIVSERKIS